MLFALYSPNEGDLTFYLTKSEIQKLRAGKTITCELVTKSHSEFLIENKISLEIKEDQSEPTYFDIAFLNNKEKEVYTYYLSRKFVEESLSSDKKLTISDGLISYRRDTHLEKFLVGNYSEALLGRRDLSSSHAKAKKLLPAHRP